MKSRRIRIIADRGSDDQLSIIPLIGREFEVLCFEDETKAAAIDVPEYPYNGRVLIHQTEYVRL